MEDKEKTELQPEQTTVSPYRSRLQEKYDDYSEDKDEEFLNRYMDDSDQEMERYRTGEKAMNDICVIYPEFGEMMQEISKGATPAVAFIKAFGTEILNPIEGDEDYDANMKAREERLASVEKRNKENDEIEQNGAESEKAIDTFCDEKGMSEDDKNVFIDQINELFSSLLYKKITPDMIANLHKMLNYDKDVTTAKEEGELTGRNATIKAQMAKDISGDAGDGLPGGRSGSITDTVDDKFRQAINSVGSGKTDYTKIGK